MAMHPAGCVSVRVRVRVSVCVFSSCDGQKHQERDSGKTQLVCGLVCVLVQIRSSHLPPGTFNGPVLGGITTFKAASRRRNRAEKTRDTRCTRTGDDAAAQKPERMIK